MECHTGSGESILSGSDPWIYELRFDKNSDLATLVRKGSQSDTVLLPSCHEGSHTADSLNGKRERVMKAHRNVLNTLYHVAPAWGNGTFDEILESMLELVLTAKMYGCETVVKIHVEAFLRQHRSKALEYCRSEPVRMLEVAMNFESDYIFEEAATNLLGRSARTWEQSHADLERMNIAAMMDRKRKIFVATLRDVEYSLFRMVAANERTGQARIATNFFRHWLVALLDEGNGSELGPGYASVYHTIAAGFFCEQAAQRQTVVEFMEGQYSNAQTMVTRIENHLKAVFKEAEKIIEPILEDKTLFQDQKKDPYRALLFMTVEEEDLPWVAIGQDAVQRGTSWKAMHPNESWE